MKQTVRRLVLAIGYPVLIAVALIGAVCLGAWAYRTEGDTIRARCRSQMEETLSWVQNSIEESLTALEALGALLDGEPNISRDRFDAFITKLIPHCPECRAWEWIPRVPSADRPRFELEARQATSKEFIIRERTGTGELIPAARRSNYYPVYYATPLSQNEAALGYDLGSEPTRLAALSHARITGMKTATAPIVLVQDQRRRNGVIVFRPVYQSGNLPKIGAERESQLRGFVLGVFSVGDILQNAADFANRSRIQFEINDQTEQGQPQLCASFPDSPESNRPLSNDGLRYSKTLRMAEREWELVVAVSNDYISEQRSYYPWLLGISSAMTVTAFAVIIQNTRFRGRILERLVAARTADLTTAKGHLESLVAAIPDILFQISGDGVFLDFHSGSPADLAIPPDAFLGKTLHEVLPKPIVEQFELAVAKLRPSTPVVSFEYKMSSQSQKDQWYQARVARGTGSNYVVLARNITEERQASTRLLAMEHEHRTVLDSLSEMVIYYDQQLKARWMNLVARQFAQRLAFDTTANDCRQFWCSNGIACPTCPVKSALGTGERQRQKLVRPLGEVWLVDASPVRDQTGAVVGVVKSIVDISELEEAKRFAAETQSQFETLFAVSPDLLCIGDVDGRLIRVNDAWSQVLGYSRDAIEGRLFQPFVHPDDQAATRDAMAELLKTSRSIGFQNRFRHQDGSYRWIEWSVCATASVVYAGGRDITARIDAETSLRESEANFRNFCETVDDLIIIIAGPSDRIVYCNPAVQKRLKYSTEDLTAMSVLDLHRPEDRSQASAIFHEMLSGKRDYCPLPLFGKDGALVPVETRICHGRWNGQDAIFGVCKDLTEQQASLQMFEAVFEANPVPMAVSQMTERTFVKVNSALCRSTGYRREELLGRTSAELGLFAYEAQYEAARERLARDGIVVGLPIDSRSKDGKIRNGLFFGKTIRHQGQQNFVSMVIDVTDLRKAEETIRQKTRELTTLLDSLPGFAFFKDLESRYVTVNETFCNALGRTKEDVIGKTDFDLFPADLAQRYRADDAAALRGGNNVFEIEEEMVEGGERIVVATRKVAVRDEHEAVIGLIGLGFNIGPQKKIESDLRDARAELESRVAERTADLITVNQLLAAENSKRRTAEASLEINREHLRELTSKLAVAEEDYRHAVAAQLHDTIGQELAMSRLRLEYAKKEVGDSQHMQIAIELLEKAIAHIQSLAHDLGSNVLYQLGLPAAVRSMGQEIAASHALEFSFEDDGLHQRLPKQLEVQILRAAKELASNVVKHAEASRFTIKMKHEFDEVVVQVDDNGRGFPQGPGSEKGLSFTRTGGFGLFGVREGLAVFGGRLEISDSLDGGTRATIRIPVPLPESTHFGEDASQ